MSRLSYLACAAALALAALAGTALALDAPRHPHLHHALYEMREARTELKEAAHDFGGHRVKALAALDTAIKQLDVALKGAGDDYRSADPGRDVYRRYANHPHIRHALVEIKAARTELQEAKHNFGGHRRQAVLALDAAIEQLEKALKYAR
jgi:hypothetical protein